MMLVEDLFFLGPIKILIKGPNREGRDGLDPQATQKEAQRATLWETK